MSGIHIDGSNYTFQKPEQPARPTREVTVEGQAQLNGAFRNMCREGSVEIRRLGDDRFKMTVTSKPSPG